MTTAFYGHSSCIDHQPGPRHPESPERLKRIYQILGDKCFDSLKRLEATRADPTVLELVHDSTYVSYILDSVPSEGCKALDPDTYLSAASGEAALHAVGGVCEAVDLVLEGEANNAFCAFRPPGHHAARDMFGLDRPDLDFVSIARGMAVEAERVDEAGDLIKAFNRGLSTPGPYLIEAVI